MKKLLCLGVGLCLLCGNAFAQFNNTTDVDAVTKVVESISTPQIDYNEISNQLAQTESLLKSQKVTAEDLSSAVRFFADNRSKIIAAKAQLEKELNFVQKRVEALGPAPVDGASETEVMGEGERS